MPTALQARYVFPISSPPIENGVVVIDGERIVSVGRDIPANATRIDLNEQFSEAPGGVAIIPGLVNTHTHLEFSDLQSPLGRPGMAFPEWIRAVIERRRAMPLGSDLHQQQRQQAIVQGLKETLRAGTTALGEIASQTPVTSAYDESPFRGYVFREWLGLAEDRVAAVQLEAQQYYVQRELARFNSQSELWHPALSPHAPYSTHWKIVELLCREAGDTLPVAMHLAESREELELLQTHGGPFRTLLDDLGVWNAEAIPRGARPLNYLTQLATTGRSLVIHGNYLADDEITFAAQQAARMSVVYCPRTHAYFRHEPYPLTKMLAAGVNVALGTDSRASNPDLSLLEELRHVARSHSDLPLPTVLELGTLRGAQALGLEQFVGTLEPGKQADLAIVPLPRHQVRDPHELLLHSTLAPAQTTIAGRP